MTPPRSDRAFRAKIRTHNDIYTHGPKPFIFATTIAHHPRVCFVGWFCFYFLACIASTVLMAAGA